MNRVESFSGTLLRRLAVLVSSLGEREEENRELGVLSAKIRAPPPPAKQQLTHSCLLSSPPQLQQDGVQAQAKSEKRTRRQPKLFEVPYRGKISMQA